MMKESRLAVERYPVADPQDPLVVPVTVGLLVIAFAVGVAVQAVLVNGVGVRGIPGLGAGSVLALRICVNVIAVGAMVGATVMLRLERLGVLAYSIASVLLALGGASLRHGLQLAVGVHTTAHYRAALADFGCVFVVMCLGYLLALSFLLLRRRERSLARASEHQRLRAADALAALQAEELRVRREVAEELHGTLQQRLVLASIRLDDLQGRMAATGADVAALAAEVDGIRTELDRIRESDVRDVSRRLYPGGVEMGLAQAVRLMVGRVPAAIAVHVHIAEALARLDGPDAPGLTVEQRLTLTRVLEEGISNALRHGHAAVLELTVEVEGDDIVLILEDDGIGLTVPGPRLSGLARLSQRLRLDGGGLVLEPGSVGGARLVARIATVGRPSGLVGATL